MTFTSVDPERLGPGSGGITGRGFKPGQSGNPGGRPKGEPSLAAIRRRRLSEPAASIPWAAGKAAELGLPEDCTLAEVLVEVELHAAIVDADPRALASIGDRVEGKPRQSVALGAEGGEGVTWSVSFANGRSPPPRPLPE